MDEKQGKRDIVGAIRRLVELAMPDLRHYYRITGALCDLSYYDGDPNYPFISNIRWGGGMSAPKAALNEFVIQLENGVEIRIDQEKRVVTLTPQEVRTEAGKNWTVKAGQGATVEARTVIVKGAQSVTLEAPNIYQNGNVTTGGHGGGALVPFSFIVRKSGVKTGQNFLAWSASFPGALLFFVPELFS